MELINGLEWNNFMVIGFLLILIDMYFFTSILLFAGISFIAVAIIDLIFEPEITILLISFGVFFMGLVVVWLTVAKPVNRSKKEKYKRNKYEDVRGTVVEIDPKIKVDFDKPVLKSITWIVESNDDDLKIKDRILIEKVEGKLITVKYL